MMWVVKILQKSSCDPYDKFTEIERYTFDDISSALVFYYEWNKKNSNCKKYACFPEEM
jgi:hypothetical protein